MLVTTVSVVSHKVGKAKIKIVLTGGGRKLSKDPKHVKLTAKGTFTPVGEPATTATKTFALKR